MADHAAAFMFHRSATLGAGAALLQRGLGIQVVAVGDHVGLDRLGNGVGAGEDPVVAKAGGAVAGDTQ